MQNDLNTKRRSQFEHFLKLGLTLLIPLVLHSQAVADDIDVYYPEANAEPNILFVVDASGSMAQSDGTASTRMQRIQAALQLTLQKIAGVKVGLMQFRGDNKAKMLLPVAPLDSTESSGGSEVHRNLMRGAVNGLPTSGLTPTVEALHEAALYFAGRPVSSETPTAAGILDGDGSYRAPSFDGCNSSSYIVLMTDGVPTKRVSTSKVESLVGKSCNTNRSAFGDLESELVCGREVVNALAHKGDYNKFTEKPIYLFTVGLGIQGGDAWLKDFADKGKAPQLTGDNFISLSGNVSEQQLAAELQRIVRTIADIEMSNVTQPVPASNFEGIANSGDLYLGVYDIGPGEYWQGNVHKFRLGADAVIYDKNDEPAVGDDGFFKESALGRWTQSVSQDGGKADVGGAREQLPDPDKRQMYTHLSAAGTDNLTADENHFDVANVKTSGNTDGLLTPALFGVSDGQAVRSLVEWARDGKLMDPLHTSVQLVTYDKRDEENTSYVFYGDNGGFFRALNATTGEEVFSFIPEELLKNLATIREDKLGERKTYGVDGPISISTVDKYGEPGVIDSDDNGSDSVTVYFGFRRGDANGHIYALDITDVTKPKLEWKISTGDTGFERLGQTWSRLAKTRILIDDTLTSVLIFGGGYDTDKDDLTEREPDDVGNAIFVVNADDGSLIWSGSSATGHTESFSKMKYSIPGSVRLIDLGSDRGLPERFYFGDTGGQLWRCDINNGSDSTDLIDCGVMLEAATDHASGDRRFFETPHVSQVLVDDKWKLAVAIGSGNRANPKDIDVDSGLRDHFYVIHDSVDRDGVAPSGLKSSDLYDASTTFYDRSSASDQDKEDIQKGWFMELREGEKVLSTASVYRDTLFFSTYKHVPNSDSCGVGSGDSRLYFVKKGTGSPAKALDPSAPVLSDRFQELDTAAIPAAPAVFRVADDTGVLPGNGSQICVGLECITVSGGDPVDPRHFQIDR